MKLAGTIVVLALALHVAGSVASAQTVKVAHGFTTTIFVDVPALVWFGGPYCPQGHTLSSLSIEICHDPVEYTCTEYLCTDPAGQQYRAPMHHGVNPSCVQNGLQTKACSSDLELPEARPTLKQLCELLPKVYDKSYAQAPLLPPNY
jgi:hypothetical protein